MSKPYSKKITVKLTADEMKQIVDAHSDVCSKLTKLEEEKSDALAGFRHRKKPLADERDRLQEIKDTGTEQREVQVFERPGLVNGTIEIVRVDTGEVVETESEDPEDEDPRQPGLFEGVAPPPRAPTLTVEGVDKDGEIWTLTAEQADRVRAGLAEGMQVVAVDIDGETVGIVRLSACSTCSMVDGNHHPDCARIQAEDAEDEGPDDGARVIQLTEGRLPDGPLVPDGEEHRPLVRKPRAKKSAAKGEVLQ